MEDLLLDVTKIFNYHLFYLCAHKLGNCEKMEKKQRKIKGNALLKIFVKDKLEMIEKKSSKYIFVCFIIDLKTYPQSFNLLFAYISPHFPLIVLIFSFLHLLFFNNKYPIVIFIILSNKPFAYQQCSTKCMIKDNPMKSSSKNTSLIRAKSSII